MTVPAGSTGGGETTAPVNTDGITGDGKSAAAASQATEAALAAAAAAAKGDESEGRQARH
jgi:hypothetical protein